MNIRELLHYETWSKETSRRILWPVLKLLKLAAIAWGVAAILCGVGFVVESHWLTNGERSAGRAALAQIEETQKLVDCDCDLFRISYGKAEAAIEVAKQNAWTLRDHRIEPELSLYLWELEQRHNFNLRVAQSRLTMQQRNLQPQTETRFEDERRSSDFHLFEGSRSSLHKELD